MMAANMAEGGRGLRWRYPQPSEDAARAQIVARMDAWWQAFEANAGRFAEHFRSPDRFDVGAFMQAHLRAISEGLAWELSPGSDVVPHRLVITPQAGRALRPLVEVLIGRAPKRTDWELCSLRPAKEPEAALAGVKARTGIDVGDWRALPTPGAEGLLNVAVTSPRLLFRSAQKHHDAAVTTLEGLLGQERLDLWIGDVILDRRDDARPWAELPARVASLVDERLARRPREPYWQRVANSPWSVLKAKPQLDDEYAQQRDLVVARTMDIELWRATHGERSFDSRRFSRAGEVFCYLKMEGSEVLDAGDGDRSEIEDAVDAALRPGQLGAQVGGGTGVRYSYIDLALTDVPAAVEALRPVLRQRKAPLRSWLLFFDDHLSDEWIPIWDEAPAPP
jgi:hypothetical protein